jgi:hypothetical protein
VALVAAAVPAAPPAEPDADPLLVALADAAEAKLLTLELADDKALLLVWLRRLEKEGS